MRSIEQSCFWLATRPPSAPAPPLRGDCRAEVAIIGAGFTGLWTALFLKKLQPELDVVVLDKGQAGCGASGRNAGIVGACVDHSHALAIAHFGEVEARQLANLGTTNFEELAEFAHDCDFEHTGQLAVALTAAQVAELQDNLEVAQQLGLDSYRLLSGEETRAEIHSPLYRGSLLSTTGGIVNPVKLVDKLKRESIGHGVRFFEHTPVRSIDGTTIHSAGGRLKANKIIMATDAYSHHLFPQLIWRFIPLYDYIIVSQPLNAIQLEAIGWRRRQGVIDGRTFFNYYRLTADNRVLWGTSEALYYTNNRVDESCDHSYRHYLALKESFYRHFPQLGSLEFPYAWGGPIAATTRLTPFFGNLRNGRILYGLGYTGHGIGTTRIAGQILAHMAVGRSHELLNLSLVKHKPIPYPPEPLRSLAVKAVTGSLRRVDQGDSPNLLLRVLDAFGVGFSS